MLAGKPFDIRSYRESIDRGVVYLSEDRKGDGVFLNLSIAANVSALDLDQVSTPWRTIETEKEVAQATELGDRLGIKRGGIWDPVSSLSGGNQQKVAIAKMLSVSPRVIFLDEPTRGVDVGAKSEIHRILRDLAREGVGVVVISSELPELIGLCDRVLVVREGLISGEVSGELADRGKRHAPRLLHRARTDVQGDATMTDTARRASASAAASAGRGAVLGSLIREREVGLILVILFLFAVMSFASPYFLTWENMRAMTMAFAVEGIVVIGMTILLISGGIDLSVGSVVAFAMVLAGWLFLQGMDPWVASAMAILACSGIGAAMGFCVTRMGLHHFIVSLAFMVIARGACLLFTQGRPLGLYTLPPEFKFIGQGSVWGIPFVIIIFIVCVLVFDFLVTEVNSVSKGLLHRQQ